MRLGWVVLAVALAVGGCQGSDEVNGSGTSSETGSGESSSSGGPTGDPTTTSADSSGGTTCGDGCTTTGSDTTSASTTGDDTTSDTTGGDSSSEGTATQESSSEGANGVCGNGIVEGDEDCDDSGQSATCDANCTTAFCGDATLNVMAGEICDAGGESFNCDVDCTPPSCGDGLVNASFDELCDDGGASPTCDDDCTAVSCGDGNQNIAALETCDDGDNSSGDGCSSNCVIEGDFGGQCRVVGGMQWCFDNDNCGQACDDVCTNLGLTIEPDDATWFAAQDSVGECQAIADAFGMSGPIDFGDYPLACLEDEGLNDLTGGGLTGGLRCSSDPSCPAAHRTDMDTLGTICDIVGARRSVCPCAGFFCGNGIVEGSEICDDGNLVNGDGCNTSCTTGPSVCDGGVDPGTGDPYVVCSVDDNGAWISIADMEGGDYHPELVCAELGYAGVGEWGGNCGSVCGFCEMVPTSCDDNGTPEFNFGMWDGVGNCTPDAFGEVACTTVMWTCI